MSSLSIGVIGWGGGVAVYVTSALQSKTWAPEAATVVANSALEIDWVRVGDHAFIAALYHPPRPTYRAETLLEYVEACVAEITHDFPLADIVIAAATLTSSRTKMLWRGRDSHRLYINRPPARMCWTRSMSSPYIYNTVRVVTSVVKSDHKAVVVFPDSSDVQNSIFKIVFYFENTK